MNSTRALARVCWWTLLALSLGVAGYASLALLNPATIEFIAGRDGIMRTLLIWHAITGAIALVIAPLQLHAGLRARHRSLHRGCGRLYVVAVAATALTGLVLAPTTRGGLPAQAAFVLLSLLWLTSTMLGLWAAQRGNFDQHREWMLRSVALTFSAVTLRIYLGLGIAAGLRFDVIYALAAWLCWVPNLLLVEWWWIASHRQPVQSPHIRRHPPVSRRLRAEGA